MSRRPPPLFDVPDAAPAPQWHADGLQDPLARACLALWLATLSLMTAYLHATAPAERRRLARHVALNLDTLSGQPCFTPPCRDRFRMLSRRWTRHADASAGGFFAALWEGEEARR